MAKGQHFAHAQLLDSQRLSGPMAPGLLWLAIVHRAA